MILRVPDYYEEFVCIADRCKDSCCIGWEIDIDEETRDYYLNQEGSFREKVEKYMYTTEEGNYSFALAEHGRCPFLDDKNLCEICTRLGEEALSEVCTEYPRFAIEYGNVLQKCLSLSCEEVGRILFHKKDSVSFMELPFGEEGNEEEKPENAAFLERVQREAISILQNRNSSLSLRVHRFLKYMEAVSSCLAEEKNSLDFDFEQFTEEDVYTVYSYEDFAERFAVFQEMEVLDEEWENVKKDFVMFYSKDTYETWMKDYVLSFEYEENFYEQLLVYFFFRYFMNSVYDYDVMSYAKLTVVFTLVIRDMDALAFHRNQRKLSVEDHIQSARIFSKEVEHSEENVEAAREAFLFEEVFETVRLCEQM